MIVQTEKATLLHPTIFHITHYKAGSQWVYAVLHAVAGDQVVRPKAGARHVTEGPIMEGMIYPCVYLTKEDFERANPPETSRKFIVIRDLRDTLVSNYFSFRYSHELLNDRLRHTRQVLESLSVSDGLMRIMGENWIVPKIQLSWIHSNDLIVRYEDLIADEFNWFCHILSYCDIDIDDAQLSHIVEMNSFANLSGRSPGTEDVKSHFRKGVVGDWKNYFDDRVKANFKKRFGHVLIETGYEKDFNW